MIVRANHVFLLCLLLVLCSVACMADNRMYRHELGVQAGAGYYVGELAPHIFQSTREVYGVQFRYKFDQRWALQTKLQRQRVVNKIEVNQELGITSSGLYQNPMWHWDVTAEYNFFRFGHRGYDYRVKSITPYIFLGIGASLYNYYGDQFDEVTYPKLGDNMKCGIYFPVGVGLKWKFADRWQLQAAWQHNVYVYNGDALEGLDAYNDIHNLNGSNIMNNDIASTITVGIVFEFGKGKKICAFCRDE